MWSPKNVNLLRSVVIIVISIIINYEQSSLIIFDHSKAIDRVEAEILLSQVPLSAF
jgi:hypothetical protein